MLTEWDKIKAVERMQRHIEDRLGEQVTLQSLARAARYSPWHAARLFKELTGLPPFEYLRRRRLAAAVERLRDAPVRVVDVAFDFEFASHEGFTRAFAREFGMTPQQFRQGQAGVAPFLPLSMRELFRRRQQGDTPMQEKPKTVFVQAVDRPARKLVVKRGRAATHYFEYCEEVGCEVWEQLEAIKEALQEPLGMWLPPNLRPAGTSEYVQGVEVPIDWSGELPEGFELAELPACKMLVFQGPPFKDEEFEEAINSLWDVMKSYKPETYGFKWADEDGPRFQLRPVGYRGYIEGRPVRSV